ncbi:MAG: hypothetical protein ACJ76N_30910 [Thermoanaerobaculia bacterium]
MRTIREAASSYLSWQQPRAFRAEYELRAGDELLATLWSGSSFGATMGAKIGASEFSLMTEGFFQDLIAVREVGAVGVAAYFRKGAVEGQLALPDDRDCRWKVTSFWSSRWAFVDDSDRPLVSFQARSQFFRAGCDVAIDPGALVLPELPILVILGWYLLLRTRDDSAAVAASA